MVTSIVVSNTANVESKVFSQEEFLRNPPEGMEWVDGKMLLLHLILYLNTSTLDKG